MKKPALLAITAVLAAGVVAFFLSHRPASDIQPSADKNDAPLAPGKPTDPALPAQALSVAALPPDAPEATATLPRGATGATTSGEEAEVGPDELAKIRQSIEERYAGLGKALHLTPEETTRIIDVLVRFQVDASSDLGLRSRSRWRQQDMEAELRAALGSRYTQWEEYNLAPGTRRTVDDLQTLLEISDIKRLSDAQASTLTATLTSERVRINHDLGTVMPSLQGADNATRLREELEWKLRYMPDINRRLVLAASQQLDAQQLAAYSKMMEDSDARQVAAMRAALAPPKGSARP